MDRDFFQRYSGVLMLAALLLTPLLIWGSVKAYERTDNRIEVWLPQEVDSTRNYRRFRAAFESGEYVLVGWPNCDLEDVRLESFAQQIEDIQVGADEELLPLVGAFDSVTTGQRLYDTLRDDPSRLSHDEALERLRGSVIGPEDTTCAILSLASSESVDRPAIIAALRRLAELCDVPDEEIRLSGDAAVSAAIDVEGSAAVQEWITISALLAVALAWLCLRSVKQAIVVFAISQLCAAAGESLVYVSGDTMNLLVTLSPVLIYVLALSSCVHLMNYYRDAVEHVGIELAPLEALRMGWAPCLLSAITTGLGLISLCVSQVLPVRSFGYYSAVGVVIAFCAVAVFLPAALSFFRVGGRRGSTEPAKRDESNPGKPSRRLLQQFSDKLVDFRWLLLGAFGVAFVILAAGLPSLRPSVEPLRFLPSDSPAVRDTIWHRDHIAPLARLEVILAIAEDCPLDLKQRIQLVGDVQQRLVKLDRVAGVMSAATFAPELADDTGPGGLRQAVRRRVQQRMLKRSRKTFLKEGFLGEDQGDDLWRITVRLQRFKDVGYDQLRETIEKHIEPALLASKVDRQHFNIAYTGAVPLIYEAQRELLDSLTVSFSVALGMIALVMVFVLRNPFAGLISMVPNVFPALVTFGVMGWRGSVVDVGAMMTASIALGIAVDDTLHFLTWFRRATGEGDSNREAVAKAIHRCAPAMTHTTLIAGLGLSVFALSTFQPVAQFGFLMFTLLVAALFGDLLLLPALLATKIGRLFAAPTKAVKPPSLEQ